MYLRQKTKEHIERVVGKPFDTISKMGLREEIAYIEKKTNMPLVFSRKIDHRMKGRGSPLIARRRLYTMEEANKKIEELK